MVFRSFLMRVLPSLLFVCVLVPGRGSAQVAVGLGFGAGPGWHGAYPPPPPDWNYPGLAGGPYVTGGYPFVGWPGYRGAFGSYWTNGLSLYGPPVPVYGPIPGVLGNDDLVRQWHARPTLGAGIGYYGWVGPFRASPRPHPLSVNVWPVIESVPGAVPATAAANGTGACLHLSVKVPQPAAELYVDGVKTAQTGTDRLFESPPVEPGKDFAYEVTARWIERGVTFERTKVVTGKAGEVVRVDLTAPNVLTTGK